MQLPEPRTGDVEEFARLLGVMAVLRRECPWDAQQTQLSLVRYLIEETGEVVDALEHGSVADQTEEFGDLLLQVVFHAQIAGERGDYTVAGIARGIADKLIRRHPHVFADDAVPEDKDATWEQRKRAEKGRTSALDGIAEHLSALARHAKVVHRARVHQVGLDLPDEPVTEAEFGAEMSALIARAHASGFDPDQAFRRATRVLEMQVRDAE